MDRIQKAVELFESGQSCSNAVFAAYSDLLGVEETTACQIASGFGGGIGGREELCGAASGMVLCGGIGYPVEDKAAVRARVCRMLDAFEDRFGALACRELKAAAKASPCAGEKDCSRYVRAAAQIVGDVLSKEEA
ncbi:MAG: hypothetical protein DBY42_03940 [Bacillota bacterium]|nr:MAG: hypothetical protein DBY42_03940 [Bacillota bacterium]